MQMPTIEKSYLFVTAPRMVIPSVLFYALGGKYSMQSMQKGRAAAEMEKLACAAQEAEEEIKGNKGRGRSGARCESYCNSYGEE